MKKTGLLLLTLFLYQVHFSQSKLTPSQMQGDLSVLHAAWTSLHPGLYRFINPTQLESAFAKLKNQCNTEMDEKRFYLLLAQLAEKIRCGHTFLNPSNLGKNAREKYLPKKVIPLLFVVNTRKQIIITHNLSEQSAILRGDLITHINGVPARAIIDSLLTVSRSDGNNSMGKKLFNINETSDEMDSYSLFDIFFPLFFRQDNDLFRLTVLPFGKTKSVQYTVSAKPFSERQSIYEPRFGKPPVSENSWDYQRLDEKTAYMKFGTFAFWNSSFQPSRYVDSIFSDLFSRPGISNLVIDIRNNEGGDNTGDHILSYLTDRPIGCDDPDRSSYRYLTIADSLKKHLSTWDDSFKKDKDPALFFKNELGLYESKAATKNCEPIKPQAITFKGKIFLITNAKNSSAGYELARNFKVNKLGPIVGETTGGSQQGINGGQFFFLKLPNSGIEIDLPLIYSYHANKPDKGISPDHPVTVTQSAIYHNTDTALELIRKLIGRK